MTVQIRILFKVWGFFERQSQMHWNIWSNSINNSKRLGILWNWNFKFQVKSQIDEKSITKIHEKWESI